MTCRSSKDADEVASKISKEFGVKSKAYKCDVGDDKLVTETFKKIDDELGPVTGLIAVCSFPVVDTPLIDWACLFGFF